MALDQWNDFVSRLSAKDPKYSDTSSMSPSKPTNFGAAQPQMTKSQQAQQQQQLMYKQGAIKRRLKKKQQQPQDLTQNSQGSY